MFEVLAFVYENYWHGDACPELPALQRKLNAVGFEDDEIQDALIWLEELKSATRSQPSRPANTPPGHTEPLDESAKTATESVRDALRVFTPAEQTRLGCAGWGLMVFLVSAGVLPWQHLELVMDRAMAKQADDLSVDDLKLIVLMVFWSLGEEPDALVLDELCDNRAERVGH
jgi:Smg protein